MSDEEIDTMVNQMPVFRAAVAAAVQEAAVTAMAAYILVVAEQMDKDPGTCLRIMFQSDSPLIDFIDAEMRDIVREVLDTQGEAQP